MATMKEFKCGEENYENHRRTWEIPKYICRDKGDDGKIYKNETTCYKWNRAIQNWDLVYHGDPSCKDAQAIKEIYTDRWKQMANEQDIEQFKCSCDKEIEADDFINVYDKNRWTEENGHLGPSIAAPTAAE